MNSRRFMSTPALWRHFFGSNSRLEGNPQDGAQRTVLQLAGFSGAPKPASASRAFISGGV